MWKSSAIGGIDSEVERHSEAEGVEAGAEVRGGRGQTEVEGLALGRVGHAGWGWFM